MTRPQLKDSPVLWKFGRIQCVFPLFSALNGNFYTRFALPRVIFTILTENEGAQALQTRFYFTLSTFKQCTLRCLKMPKNEVFSKHTATDYLESPTKVIINALWVSSARGTTIHPHFMLLHLGILVFLGAILTLFQFLHFSGTISALFLSAKAKTTLKAFRASYFQTNSCFYNTFHRVSKVLASTSALNQENCQKSPKIAKNEVFLPLLHFFTRKTLILLALHL